MFSKIKVWKNPFPNKKKKKISNRGVELRIQLSAVRAKLPDDYPAFKNMKGLYYEEGDDGYYRYFIGSFQSIEKANKLKQKMLKKGFKTAFLVAYKDGQKINIIDGLNLLRKDKQ